MNKGVILRTYIFNILFNSESRESFLGRKLQHLNLLTKLGPMTKTSLRRLSPKEFDAALLKKLTEEGRVFINLPREINRNAYAQEILDYVQAIRDCASEPWRDEIDALWQEILDNECLADFLTMKRGVCAGHINRYAVTNLVCRMQNSGIYRKDLSMLTLHLKLEGVERKNKYYTSCGNFPPSTEARQVLRKLFSKV